MTIEFNMLDKINLPTSSTKKKLQLVNGKLVIINFDGSMTPVGESKVITNVTENKIDLNSVLITYFDNKFNSLLPIIDSKASKEELILSFQSLQDELKTDLSSLKEYLDLLVIETKSNLNQLIDSNKSEVDSEVVDLYNSITDINESITSVITNISQVETSLKNDFANILNEFKIQTNQKIFQINNKFNDYAKKTDLPFVPNLIAGKNIKIESDSSGDLTISAIVPTFVGGGGGISKTAVQEMIDASSSTGNYLPLTGGTVTGPVIFDTTTTSTQTGAMFYDIDEHALVYRNDTQDVHIGQESLVRVRNNSGSTIVAGKAVVINGVLGNRPTITLANNSSVTAEDTIGLLSVDIPDNTDGFVVTNGLAHGFNTNSFNEGDELYLGTNGDLTTTKPSYPKKIIKIGLVIRSHNTQGKVLVRIDTDLDSAVSYVINSLDKVLGYNGSDQLVSISGADGTKQFNYNGSGQLTSISGSGAFKTKSFNYDSGGKLLFIDVVN